MESSDIDSRLGYQRCQFHDEVLRLNDYMRDDITVRGFQFIAVGEQGDACKRK